jgi:ATP-binding cassette, subfamily B, bacterial PglK
MRTKLAVALKAAIKKAATGMGLERQSVDLLTRFYRFYGYKCKNQLVLLFLGAIFSGLIEILGLILLYYLIRLLVDLRSVGEGHFILELFSMLGVENRDLIVPIFGGCILFIFVLKNIYLMGYYHLQHLILRRWKIGVSTYLMSRYLHAPYSFLLQYNSATIIRNVNTTVGAALNGFVLSALNYGSNIITGLIILSLLCMRYMTVTIIVGVVLVVTTVLQNRFLKKKQIQLGVEREELASEQTKSVYQGLHAVKETKVVGKESYFLNIFKDINNRSVNNEMKSLFYTRLPSHMTEITVIISVILITITVLLDTAGNVALSMSSLGVLAAISFRLAPIMNRTISSMQGMNKNTPSMQNLFREIDRLKDLNFSYINRDKIEKLSFRSTLELKNVSFKYRKSKSYAVKGINLQIKKGEFVGIVGSSGAGKTTLVDIILGLLIPSRGSIEVDGVVLGTSNMSNWQKNIGYVPQSVYMGDGTIAENIAFGVKKSLINQDRLKRVLSDVKLTEYTDEVGFNFNIGENGKNLSGGQRQRLGIARALYLEADILVLDEATSALDVPTEVKISEAINKIRVEKTVIVIAHRLSTVFDADKIVFMSGGQIIDVGSYKELFLRNKEFNSLARLAKIIPDSEPTL